MNAGNGVQSSPTALILAAGRRGRKDPVARLQDKSHKCLVEVDGVAMIERVIQALLDSGCCRRILVSIESKDILRELEQSRRWLHEGVITVVPSAPNLADSVLALAESAAPPLPLLITTADNALHTPELIRDFVARARTNHRDVSVAVTREQTVLADHPDEDIRFFRFRDGGYSFCNLFAIHSAAGLQSARVFRSGGQFRKRPRQILKVFGAMTLLMYKLRISSLEACFRRISGKLGIDIRTVEVAYSFAPIDVDNPRTLALSEKILKQRRAYQAASD